MKKRSLSVLCLVLSLIQVSQAAGLGAIAWAPRLTGIAQAVFDRQALSPTELDALHPLLTQHPFLSSIEKQLNPADVQTSRWPDYIWHPFHLKMTAAYTRDRLTWSQGKIDAFHRVISERSALARIVDGHIEIEEELLPEAAQHLSEALGRPMSIEEVRNYFLYHEQQHLKYRTPDQRLVLDSLAVRLKTPSLYADDPEVRSYDELKFFFARNFGERFLDVQDRGIFPEELRATYETERWRQNGAKPWPKLLAYDESQLKERRRDLPGRVTYLLEEIHLLEIAQDLARQYYGDRRLPSGERYIAYAQRRAERVRDFGGSVEAEAAGWLILVNRLDEKDQAQIRAETLDTLSKMKGYLEELDKDEYARPKLWEILERQNWLDNLPWAPARGSSRVILHRDAVANKMSQIIQIAQDADVFLLQAAHLFESALAADPAERIRACDLLQEVYATLCDSRGREDLARRLRNEAEKRLNPREYSRIADERKALTGKEPEVESSYLSEMARTLENFLSEHNFPTWAVKIVPRAKDIWSLKRKMERERSAITDIGDHLGLMIVLQTEDAERLWNVISVVKAFWAHHGEEVETKDRTQRNEPYLRVHIETRDQTGTPFSNLVMTLKNYMKNYLDPDVAHWIYNAHKVPTLEKQSFRVMAPPSGNFVKDFERANRWDIRHAHTIYVDVLKQNSKRGEYAPFTSTTIELPEGSIAMDAAAHRDIDEYSPTLFDTIETVRVKVIDGHIQPLPKGHRRSPGEPLKTGWAVQLIRSKTPLQRALKPASPRAQTYAVTSSRVVPANTAKEFLRVRDLAEFDYFLVQKSPWGFKSYQDVYHALKALVITFDDFDNLANAEGISQLQKEGLLKPLDTSQMMVLDGLLENESPWPLDAVPLWRRAIPEGDFFLDSVIPAEKIAPFTRQLIDGLKTRRIAMEDLKAFLLGPAASTAEQGENPGVFQHLVPQPIDLLEAIQSQVETELRLESILVYFSWMPQTITDLEKQVGLRQIRMEDLKRLLNSPPLKASAGLVIGQDKKAVEGEWTIHIEARHDRPGLMRSVLKAMRGYGITVISFQKGPGAEVNLRLHLGQMPATALAPILAEIRKIPDFRMDTKPLFFPSKKTSLNLPVTNTVDGLCNVFQALQDLDPGISVDLGQSSLIGGRRKMALTFNTLPQGITLSLIQKFLTAARIDGNGNGFNGRKSHSYISLLGWLFVIPALVFKTTNRIFQARLTETTAVRLENQLAMELKHRRMESHPVRLFNRAPAGVPGWTRKLGYFAFFHDGVIYVSPLLAFLFTRSFTRSRIAQRAAVSIMKSILAHEDVHAQGIHSEWRALRAGLTNYKERLLGHDTIQDPVLKPGERYVDLNFKDLKKARLGHYAVDVFVGHPQPGILARIVREISEAGWAFSAGLKATPRENGAELHIEIELPWYVSWLWFWKSAMKKRLMNRLEAIRIVENPNVPELNRRRLAARVKIPSRRGALVQFAEQLADMGVRIESWDHNPIPGQDEEWLNVVLSLPPVDGEYQRIRHFKEAFRKLDQESPRPLLHDYRTEFELAGAQINRETRLAVQSLLEQAIVKEPGLLDEVRRIFPETLGESLEPIQLTDEERRKVDPVTIEHVQLAIALIQKWHAGHRRKKPQGGYDYWLHPVLATYIMVRLYELDNPTMIIAELLHDVLEDVEEHQKMPRQVAERSILATYPDFGDLLLVLLDFMDKNKPIGNVREVVERELIDVAIGKLSDHLSSMPSWFDVGGDFAYKQAAKEVRFMLDAIRIVSDAHSFVSLDESFGAIRKDVHQKALRRQLMLLISQTFRLAYLGGYYEPEREKNFSEKSVQAINRETARSIREFLNWTKSHRSYMPVDELTRLYGSDNTNRMIGHFLAMLTTLERQLLEHPDQEHADYLSKSNPPPVSGEVDPTDRFVVPGSPRSPTHRIAADGRILAHRSPPGILNQIVLDSQAQPLVPKYFPAFGEWMDMALHGPRGYYQRPFSLGTATFADRLSPYLGGAIAEQAFHMLPSLMQLPGWGPDSRFTIVEIGGLSGRLAQDVISYIALRTNRDHGDWQYFGGRFRYEIYDPSPVLRELQRETNKKFCETVFWNFPLSDLSPDRRQRTTGLVIANELFSRASHEKVFFPPNHEPQMAYIIPHMPSRLLAPYRHREQNAPALVQEILRDDAALRRAFGLRDTQAIYFSRRTLTLLLKDTLWSELEKETFLNGLEFDETYIPIAHNLSLSIYFRTNALYYAVALAQVPPQNLGIVLYPNLNIPGYLKLMAEKLQAGFALILDRGLRLDELLQATHQGDRPLLRAPFTAGESVNPYHRFTNDPLSIMTNFSAIQSPGGVLRDLFYGPANRLLSGTSLSHLSDLASDLDPAVVRQFLDHAYPLRALIMSKSTTPWSTPFKIPGTLDTSPAVEEAHWAHLVDRVAEIEDAIQRAASHPGHRILRVDA